MSSIPPPAYVHPGPPPEPPEYPEGLPPLKSGADLWKPWTALVALALGVIAIPAVVQIFAVMVVVISGGDVKDLPAGSYIALQYGQELGFLLTPILLAQWMSGRTVRQDFGITRPKAMLAGVGIAVGVWFAFALFSALWVTLIGSDERDSLPSEFGIDDSTVNLVLVMVAVVVLAPIAEELLFRGYVFRTLRNWHGPWLAAVLSGVLFGGIHVGSSPVAFLVPLMFLGIGLALLYQWTGSLYLTVGLHAFNNGIAFSSMQDWGWEYAVVVPGAIIFSLLGLWLIGRALGDRPGRAAVVSAP